MMTHSERAVSAEKETGRARDAPGRSRRKWIVAAAIMLLAGLLALVWLLNRPRSGLVYETNVVVGDLPGKTPEERQAELEQIVEEGLLSMSLNATPSASLSRDGGRVNWLIENPSNQGKLIRVEVYVTDTGEKIYETGALRPGTYVESAPLDVELSPGEYDCTAVFYTYRLDTEAYIGQANAEFILVLLE